MLIEMSSSNVVYQGCNESCIIPAGWKVMNLNSFTVTIQGREKNARKAIISRCVERSAIRFPYFQKTPVEQFATVPRREQHISLVSRESSSFSF